MCFEIVCCHWWRVPVVEENIIQSILNSYRGVAVCVFMCLAFFLFRKKLDSINRSELTDRCKRIILPNIVWLFPYLALRIIVWHQQGKSLVKLFREVIVHIFFGHSEFINAALWFQMSLFYITVILVCVRVLSRDHWKVVFIVLAMICTISEYTPLHSVWSTVFPNDVAIACGRTVEMIPLAVVGSLLPDVTQKLQKKYSRGRQMVLYVVSFLLYVITMAFCFSYATMDGYSYAGIEKVIIASLSVLLFRFMPVKEKPVSMAGRMASKGVVQLSQHTLGIYCVHNLIGMILSKVYERFLGRPCGTITDSLLIFVFSLIVAIVISHSFRGRFKRIVC